MYQERTDILTGGTDLVVFTINEVLCALRVDEVQEIKRVVQITRVHRAPDYVSGVVNLRGQIVTVIDLRLKLNYKQSVLCDRSRIVVVKRGTEQIGLLVDSIEDAVVATAQDITSTPSTIKGVEKKFFKGVYKTADALVAILDIEALLEKEKSDKSQPAL